MVFRAEKVIASLPQVLTPNTVYFVRVGEGFDEYVTDETGAVAHGLNAADPAALKADTADMLTAAFTSAIDDDGIQTSGTYTPSVLSGSNVKRIGNGGSFGFAPPTPAANEAIHLAVIIENVAGAGAITTVGFQTVAGAPFTTTLNDRFLCHLVAINIGGTTYSFLDVVAL